MCALEERTAPSSSPIPTMSMIMITTFYGIALFSKTAIIVSLDIRRMPISFNASMSARSPDLTIGYNDSTTGSDVFNVLQVRLILDVTGEVRTDANGNETLISDTDPLSFAYESVYRNLPLPRTRYRIWILNEPHVKFVETKQSTVCGALVYILVKRYPNNQDVTNLIAQLRQSHVFVYIVVHNIPSGGVTTDPLFEIATKTNGFCIFNSGPNFWVSVDDATAVNYRPYQFISQNYVVSGSGRVELPVFKTPSVRTWSEQVLAVTTIQSHKLDASFKSLNYTIASVDGSFVLTGPDAENGYPRFGSAILAQPQLNGTTYYKWTIDYHFTNNQPQVIETRMYSEWYHDFLPLPAN